MCGTFCKGCKCEGRYGDRGCRRSEAQGLCGASDPGDYVMVHAGAAIAKITDDDESETGGLLDLLSAEDGEMLS